jgi:ornithine carbamoyltransferase
MQRPARHLISLDDLTDGELSWIVDQGVAYATAARRPAPVLDGAVIGVHFRKTSTRTRTAFSAGALRLGAQIIGFGPDDLQTNSGETWEDTGRVMGLMLDGLVARTAGPPEELRMLAAGGSMSVVNAMTEDEHPTQALTDLVTLQQRFGRIGGLRVLYVGEGNNTAAALALAMTRFPGSELHVRTPPGYGLTKEVLVRAEASAAQSGSLFDERHEMADVPPRLDVIYTSRWQTTGTSKADPTWREVFAPFRVTGRLWSESPDAVFMHDLPAHRGEEVDAEVLDGPASIAFPQAANKLTSAMAVLHHCLAHAA